METSEIEIGKWYMISRYGFIPNIKGKAVSVCGNFVTLRFYWGGLTRTNQVVGIERIIGKCDKPRTFSNY